MHLLLLVISLTKLVSLTSQHPEWEYLKPVSKGIVNPKLPLKLAYDLLTLKSSKEFISGEFVALFSASMFDNTSCDRSGVTLSYFSYTNACFRRPLL